MTKVRIDLRDAIANELGGRTTHIPATVDIDELFEFNDIDEAEIDLDDILAGNRLIAHLWSVEDMRNERPHLTEDQAWEVLKAVESRINSEFGINRDFIRDVADELYPQNRLARPAKTAEVIASYGEGDERENLVDLLTDTMHWCESFGEPFEEFHATARIHFAEEAKSHKREA